MERTTMHIPRKHGDSIEGDWAGDKLYIVDRDTGEADAAYLFFGILLESGGNRHLAVLSRH